MTTFKDFLIWYNNLDVGPFVTAVESGRNNTSTRVWTCLKLLYHSQVSPGKSSMARQNNAQFSLIDQKNADLHQVLTQNLFGGPSVIFHRHAESEVTKIRGGKIGKFPVDEWDQGNKTAYQFHGCYYHGHLCEVTKNVKDTDWHASRESRYERTKSITKFIREMGSK